MGKGDGAGAEPGGFQQVREREALLSEAEGIAGVGSYLWEPGHPPVWSDGFYRILGYQPGRMTPSAEAFHAVVHPDDRDRVLAAQRAVHDGRLPDIEYRILRADTGELRFIRGTGRVYLEPNEVVPRRLVGALLDVTDARLGALRDEQALSQARHAERLGKMGSFVVDLDPLASAWSDGIFEMLGVDRDEDTIGLWTRFMHPDEQEAHSLWFAEVVQKGEAAPIQSRFVHASGEVRHALTHAALVHFESDGKTRVVGTTIDVTDRVRLEERLRHAAKMEAVGTLAAGVAHDFNNYLMAISGCLEMLGRNSGSGASPGELLQQARHATTRCMELTQQLLAFARRRPARQELVRFDEMLGRIGSLLSPSLGQGIELSVTGSDARLATRIDPAHLEQIVANLVLNGRDAIRARGEGGGTIEIRTDTVTLNRPRRLVPVEVGVGHWACIQVQDDGCGVEPDDLQRIFEPYFTTKAIGRGTGLGLAAVYGAVQQNGGHVTVQSEPGQGTCFTVWLPVVEGAEELPPTEAKGKSAGRTPRRVLVVDDIPEVRRVTALALRSAGYDVQEACDGVDALEQVGAGRFDLVLTDVRMPRMTGTELAQALAERMPDLPVVLMTGYSDTDVGAADLPVLDKPVSPADLARAVASRFG